MLLPPTMRRSSRVPVLTGVVAGVTLLISLLAQFAPAVMDLLVRDRQQLSAGQWWRAVTPILVQPQGWGQLAFNLAGIVLVGAAAQRQVGAAAWLGSYLLGGVGSVAIYSIWHPAATGGGSSAAVAALIGLLAALAGTGRSPSRAVEYAHWYAIFFCSYLTALDLGGITAAIVAGNLSIVLIAVGRRAMGPAWITAITAPIVLVAGIVMTFLQDDHGTGLLIGGAVAATVLARRWSRQSFRRRDDLG